MTAMTGTFETYKRPLLMVAFVALACAATLLPIRSTPPMLLSDADGVEWKCSKSAVILTTCTKTLHVEPVIDSSRKKSGVFATSSSE